MQNIKNIYHLFQALVANIWYGFPSRKLKVIGITGTDGKTTTTHLIYHILKTAGKKVSMVSSVYAKVGDKAYDTGFHVTTPDVFPLQKLLAESVTNGDEYFVLETTSHALYQYRVFGIQYEVGVLTNITHEHLDMHHSMQEYTGIKSRLFTQSRFAVLNAEDQSFPEIKKHILKNNIYPYSLKKSLYFKSLNVAEFNKYNYLAAYTACHLLGIEDKLILKAIDAFQLPQGRYEIIVANPFTVVIDFAHTPNGINEILKDVRKRFVTKKNKLIHVFGSASQRDASKRPFMGEASATYADITILTEEDYRDEDPQKICREIASGLENKGFKKTLNPNKDAKKYYMVITDRKRAIEQAINVAKQGDIIVITGKGHEKSLCRGKVEVPWSDTEAVKSLLHQ